MGVAMADSPSVPLTYQVPLIQPLTHLTHLTQPLTQPLTHLSYPMYMPSRTVGQYPVFNYPGLVWSTPGLNTVQSLVPRVIGTEGHLPSQKLEGEDEPAALEF